MCKEKDAVEREGARRYAACRQEKCVTTGSDAEQPEQRESDGVVASQGRRQEEREGSDGRLNVSLPSLLLHSTSSRLAVSARACLLTARLSAGCSSHFLSGASMGVAFGTPRPYVHTRDPGLLSGSCHCALLLALFTRQTGP
jgi:hypothetical protein